MMNCGFAKTGGSIRWLLPTPASTSEIQKVRSRDFCRKKPCDELRNENDDENTRSTEGGNKRSSKVGSMGELPDGTMDRLRTGDRRA